VQRLTQDEDRLTVLYSANFVFICPNCHKEQLQTVGRKTLVYTCRWCDKQYDIRINIQATDNDGNMHSD
jgi:hypothetical protein